MAIFHIPRFIRPLSRMSHDLYRGPSHLTSCLSKRFIQEFPERKANNQIPDDYVLILPEKLDEHESSNELLKFSKHHDIDYSKLDVETLFKGLSQALLNLENFLTDVENQQMTEVKPSKELFRDIERHLYPLDSAFNVAVVLMNVENEKYKYHELYSLVNRYYKVRSQRYERFKDAIHEYVLDGYNKLPEADKKMVKMYHKKNMNGLFLRSLDANTQLLEYKRHLTDSISRFKYNLRMTDEKFSHTVDEPDLLAAISSEFDDNLTLHHKERTPLKITPSTYHKFIRLCPDRFVRQMLWQTYNRRCSPKGSPKNNNLSVIDDIRVFRRKISDLSGYRSHLDSRLSDAMAESKQQISNMLQFINEENIKELNDRLQELTDYAADNSDGQAIGESGLQEYDIDYWAHRYAHDILIGRNEAQLKNYFSLPVVMNGLRNFFKSYFGLEIEYRKDKVPYWNESIQTLDVKRNNTSIGSIIYDPYSRPGKPMVEPFYARLRCRTKESGLAPMRFISTAFKQDVNSKHAHLSFLDIANLFHSFGIVLQRLLYNYDYYELNVYGALEIDVNMFFPNLCMAHFLTNHKILQSCSERDGSKPIDSELASRVVKAHSYFRCFRTWRELYQAHLDMEAHASLRDISKLVEDIYPIYSPFPRSPDNYDFCTFENIFVGPNDGAQYSGLWSKQLVNFCMSEMKSAETGDKTSDMTRVRAFNERLIDNLFAPNNFNTKDCLQSLLGRSFEPTKTSLRVL